MSTVQLMTRIAETDVTFTLQKRDWLGKCLVCGGPLRFDADTGEGADIEHIQPRSLGGTNELHNLGITHRKCNGEKGRRWDGHRRRHAEPDRYQALITRLRAERERRWHDPSNSHAARHPGAILA